METNADDPRGFTNGDSHQGEAIAQPHESHLVENDAEFAGNPKGKETLVNLTVAQSEIKENDKASSLSDTHEGSESSATPGAKRKQEGAELLTPVQDTQHGGEEDDPSLGPSTASAIGNSSGKKISAKELVQHVKNQKKKIQEKEAEVALLQTKLKAARMRALAMAIDIVGKAKLEKRMVRCFHRWVAYAERESAAVEVERVAGLAHKSNSELENIKAQLENLQKERSEQEVAQKKLRILLAKAKQQIADQAKANEKVPEGFCAEDVSRKVRAPDGTVFCLIATRKQPSPVYEWREESLVLSWLASGRGGEQFVREKPTLEDEIQERYSRASRELETALNDKQQELDALNDRFEQYRRRAELALERAESSVQVSDSRVEDALREELSRVARDRDAVAEKVEELRMSLDSAESNLSALRVREKALREERDDLERRSMEAARALEVARAAWEQSLTRAELETEDRLRAERSEARAAMDKADELEKQLAQALQREKELKEQEFSTQDRLSRADDRIEALRAAVARAEAKANSAELSRHLASSSMVAAPIVAQNGQSASAHRQGSVLSLSSPRPSVVKTTLDALEVGDSASVAGDATRPRRDSDNSELSIVTGAESGSKYFVDQIGALRAAHRNERVEWQRERSALREQFDDALKRKEMAEEKITSLEKRITELNLAIERQRQLADSARTVGETPDGLLYLKNAVFRFITADDDSERETLLPVITLLLKFSPEEVQTLSRETVRPGGGGAGILGGLLSRFS